MEECGQAETELPRATHATPLPSVLKTEIKDDLCLLSICPPDSMGWVKGKGRPGTMQCSAGNGILTRGKRRKLHQQIFQIEKGAGRHLYGTFLSEFFFSYFFFPCIRKMFFFHYK
jgi:hypothetical protein